LAFLICIDQKLFENWAAVKAENLRLQLERGGESRRTSFSSGHDDREREKVSEIKFEVNRLFWTCIDSEF